MPMSRECSGMAQALALLLLLLGRWAWASWGQPAGRYLSVGDGSALEFDFPERSQGVMVVSSRYLGTNGTASGARLSAASLAPTVLTVENVSPDEQVSSVKRLVAESLSIPVSQQRLLFKGKALADELRLCDYSIGPGSKLNLVVKPPEKASPEELGHRGPLPPFPSIWHSLAQVLARHFSPADTQKVLEQLQKDYERSLRLLSLDDIERLATRLLHPEVADAVEMGFLD